ncbi:hypothetical protein AVEN_201868-1 [Araneus ventricosus]|uniref:DUF7041 domain-containing protein n=1 Tax=Araneus ventricosus TaxID=182803 RepID=A0A4Y2KMM6_ARAVE|nr:hypothetical protein AVEN_201868-1 [Araneus ventricosus]
MSGDQYHISIRQLYETENKLRISRELKLISHTSGSFDIDLFDNSDQDENSVEIIDDFFQGIEVSNSDIDKVAYSLPVITYLAGYCSHSAHKNVKCYECRKKLLTDKEMDVDNFKLIKSCGRGGMPETKPEVSPSVDQDSQLSRTAFKAPVFCENDPELWFFQVESQLVIASISSDSTKFHAVVAALNSNVLPCVRDILKILED